MRNHLVRSAILGAVSSLLAAAAAPGAAATLDQIRASGTIRLGYLAEARPFSFKSDAGEPGGYAIELCEGIAEGVKTDLGLSQLDLSWVELPVDSALSAVTSGQIDLLCTPVGETLARRKDVSFSLPVFPGGTGALMRSDAPTALKEILSQDRPAARPIWRGTPARTFLDRKTFAVISGSLSEAWLNERAKTLQLTSVIAPVATSEAGVQAVADRDADVFFAQMPILLDGAKRHEESGSLIVLPRLFTHEPLALPMIRGDEDFRLVVDRAISATFRAPEFRERLIEWVGEPDEGLAEFFRATILHE